MNMPRKTHRETQTITSMPPTATALHPTSEIEALAKVSHVISGTFAIRHDSSSMGACRPQED